MLTATLTVERAPTGWSIQAYLCVDDELSSDAVIDHAWWFGIGAGTDGVVRWQASSAAASEHGLIDDSPGASAPWVRARGAQPIELWLWLRLETEEGGVVERSFHARHVVTDAGTFDVDLLLIDVDCRPPYAREDQLARPPALVTLDADPGHFVRAVMPTLGVIEEAAATVVLNTTEGRITLPGFARGRLEVITPGPGGRLAAVWTVDERWHLALYRLPSPTPHAVIPPQPSANGNSPVPGTFSADGTLALLPAGFDELGLYDVERGTLRHRLSAGGYVRDVARAIEGDRAWIVGHGHARSYDTTTGALVEEHQIPQVNNELGFDPRSRRVAWLSVFDRDDPSSAIDWYDLDGGCGQLLVREAFDYMPTVLDDGSVVAWGTRGLVHVEPSKQRLRHLTGPLSPGFAYFQPFVAERHGDALIIWTSDRTHYKITVRADAYR